MALTFNGPDLLIELDAATLSYTSQQIYSAWKEWVLSGNANWPPAFRVTGGDVAAGVKAPHFYYLRNDIGWRIKKPEATINARIEGNLLFEAPDELRYAEPEGNFTPTVEINLSQIATVDISGISAAILASGFDSQEHEWLRRIYVMLFHPRWRSPSDPNETQLEDSNGDLFKFDEPLDGSKVVPKFDPEVPDV